jgi:hypothetical protein
MTEIFALLIESTSYYRKHLILEKLIGNILLDAFQHSFKKTEMKYEESIILSLT